jgi:hypothetical protein
MNLKIYKSNDFDATGKSFTAPAVRFTTFENVLYENNAAIPDLPLTGNEFKFDMELETFNMPDSMFFFKVQDQKIADIAQNLGLQEIQSEEDLLLAMKIRQNVFNVFLNKINSYFKKFTTKPFKLHDIYVGGKEQITSTIDFDLKPPKKTGLHVDNWDKLKISELENSANRICINLGKGHRYFLFIKNSVQEMKTQLSNDDPVNLEIENSNQIAKMFLMSKIPYEICFFKLAPFEGYIAPTENLIHDASNFDSPYIDIQITARGFFNPALIIEKNN